MAFEGSGGRGYGSQGRAPALLGLVRRIPNLAITWVLVPDERDAVVVRSPRAHGTIVG
jgi:hypothetical protein